MLSEAIAKSKHLSEGDDMQHQLFFTVNTDAHKEPFRGILRQAQDDTNEVGFVLLVGSI